MRKETTDPIVPNDGPGVFPHVYPKDKRGDK